MITIGCPIRPYGEKGKHVGKKMFLWYGELDWLEPEAFWTDGWLIVETTEDMDGEPWDIVGKGSDTRYSAI